MHLVKKLLSKFVRHRFKLATTDKEIIHVYRVGPHSCMKGHTSVGTYADSDLAVAYLQNIVSKRIVARAVVWPEKKLYYRIYGDKDRLRRSLEYRGYKKRRLSGAKLKLHYYRKYGPPHIDGIRGFHLSKDHITIR